MTTSQVTVRTLAVLTLVAGFATAGRAQPTAVTAEWAFKQHPKQQGVNVSTPTPDRVPNCKVSPIPNPKDPKTPMGYLVSDPDGKPVRQFVSYDNKNFNIIAFYVEGVEAYREVYPPNPGEPYQFRWLGPNGSKWGLDRNRDHVIDEWVVISPEEVTQELVRAVVARDAKRLESLLVTKENLAGFGLPANDVTALQTRAAAAANRLTTTADALKLSDKAKWQHAEFGVPQTRPADAFEGSQDFTSHKNGTVMVVDGDKTAFLQTGEMVQIGRAWKLVDGPTAGVAGNAGGNEGPVVEPQIAQFVEELNKLDKTAPNPPTVEAIAAFNSKRADLLEQIVAKANANAKESWIRMLIDSHAAASEGGKPGNKHLIRLQQWKDAIVRGNGDPALAAYAAYRLLATENSIALANLKPDGSDLPAVQEKWRSGLEAYAKAFPKSAEAPEAVLRLAMAFELAGGKDMTEMKANEAKAKQWYEYLVKNYAGSQPQATKAAGALKRLDSEGKPLELSGPQLGSGQTFDAAQKDKIVVVYYWASWSQSLPEDAKKFDALLKTYGPKGLTLVTVSVDQDAKQATDAIARTGLPGTHLFAPGGLDASPLAASYGIMAPPHVIVAGKDGKIANRNGHVMALEEDVKKLLEGK
jgi:thiol-disulfide isomerase/thioredoxin